MKGLSLFFVFLLYPSSLFASIPLDCCSLYFYTPESNPLLKSMSDLKIDSDFSRPDNTFTLPQPIPGENTIENQSVMNMAPVTYDLPIIQNSYVDHHINFFTTTYKERFEKGLSLSGRYIPMMQEMLVGLNLPKDLAYLPLIESNFNVHAVSRAKATGPWQFIKGTGKRYGLRIDNWIDERRDPIKSTKAAAQYLQDLYEMFNSWLLAMASYNAGENRIMRAMNLTQANDFWTLENTGKIPRETRNYVPKFMAATIIAKNPEAYGFSVEYESPLLYDEVEIKKQVSLHTVARAVGVSVKEIKAYNPELKREKTPPNYPHYLLKLPPGKRDVFLENFPKIKEVKSKPKGRLNPVRSKQKVSLNQDGDYWHQIKLGETIDSISRKYDVSVKQLLKANRLHKNSVIRAGRSIVIPRKT